MANISTLDSVFQAAGTEWNVDPTLLKAIATQESGGNTQAVSRKGAQGLMQIMPDTAKGLGVTDPTDPVQSIFGGAKYLSEALDNEGHPETALLYYHGGPGWRQKYGTESANYVPAVAAKYQQIAAATPKKATDATAASVVQNTAPNSASAPTASTAPAKDISESDADFLKRSNPTGEGEDDSAFLARTGGAPPTTKTPDMSATPDDVGTFSPEGVYVPPGAIPAKGAPVASLEDLRGRIQQGEINALKWMAPDKDAGPIERGLRYAAMTGTHLAAGIAQAPLNALVFAEQGGPGPGGLTYNPQTGAMNLTPEAMAAASLGANPLRFGGALKPQLGPWPAPEQFGPPTPEPFGPPKAPTPAFVPPNTSNVPLPPRAPPTDTRPAMIPPNTTVDPVTGEVTPVQQPPTAAGGGPQPGMGAAQPGGAQVTPSAAAQMTPEEIATQRTVADKQWLNQTQQPGVRDTTEHIPGITPNLVEQEQTVTAARELKALKNLNPELTQTEREILDHNTDLRKGFYADTVGSDVTRAADLKVANDKINADLANVWQGKGDADPANVHTQIQTELAGSAGELPPLKSAMKQVSDSLENAGTDPQAMYRTHRLINYLQSKQGQLANPGYGAGDVQAALTRVKATLAKTIDDAAPGFGNAMSDYSTARGPIDAAKALQDRENALYDSRGHMSFLKVHGLMRDIIDAKKWDAPNDPLAGASDAQVARLKALHDDLKRVASAKDLATAQGSDTAMNAVDIAKAYGKLAGRAGIEGAANLSLGPGVGSMVVRGAENLLRPITSGIAARQQMRRGMEILQPKPNPLQPPP